MKNPIRHTVAHYIDMRWARLERREQRGLTVPKRRTIKRSNFCRFFRSLENRGKESFHGRYETWTKAVRKQMEAAGTWVKPQSQANITFIAEYVSRLHGPPASGLTSILVPITDAIKQSTSGHIGWDANSITNRANTDRTDGL